MEDIIEPDLAICDAHHHLWDFPAQIPGFISPYMMDALLKDIGSGHKVESTVFVECTAFYNADSVGDLQFVGETEFANGVAAMSASNRYGAVRICEGIVGRADFSTGAAVENVLAAHVRAAADRFRGIRHAAGWDASPEVGNSHSDPKKGLYADARFREGFAKLEDFNLSFDAWQYHPQLPELIDLARAFPNISIVANHVGGLLGTGPYGNRESVFADWKGSIAQLAKCPNVVMKLGGLGMAMCGFGFHERSAPVTSEELAAAWRPYVETCIEAFGPARCMFESNFPVDKVSCSYTALWNAFKRISKGASADEKALLFRDTARRVYRLDSGQFQFSISRTAAYNPQVTR
ncbi:MAG TPA: amidohydrolase family protein [Rhizomicrobium sp.]|nr:amidohydrolase family protein [Rhizomicrobium sp.]